MHMNELLNKDMAYLYIFVYISMTDYFQYHVLMISKDSVSYKNAGLNNHLY